MPRKNERRRESLDDQSCNTSSLQKEVKELRVLDFVLPTANMDCRIMAFCSAPPMQATNALPLVGDQT
jgi:hypothetical protein